MHHSWGINTSAPLPPLLMMTIPLLCPLYLHGFFAVISFQVSPELTDWEHWFWTFAILNYFLFFIFYFFFSNNCSLGSVQFVGFSIVHWIQAWFILFTTFWKIVFFLLVRLCQYYFELVRYGLLCSVKFIGVSTVQTVVCRVQWGLNNWISGSLNLTVCCTVICVRFDLLCSVKLTLFSEVQ